MIGNIMGMVIWNNVRQKPAPSTCAASGAWMISPAVLEIVAVRPE